MERSHFLVAAAVTMAVLSCSAGEHQHKVGGHGQWAPNVNFTEWAAGERFYVGDWLVFLYEKGYYDVVQVNATDYERCSAEHPIRSYAKGKSYAFRLNHTGSYHFICSRGQCWSGMKLAINVTADVADDSQPAPAPAPSLQPSSAVTASAFLATALLVAACAAISVVTGYLD